jgi:hypothetical protein
MIESIVEFIVEVLIESIVYSFPKYLGACLKWVLYLGKKSFKDILDEPWNRRIGASIILLIVSALIFIVY